MKLRFLLPVVIGLVVVAESAAGGGLTIVPGHPHSGQQTIDSNASLQINCPSFRAVGTTSTGTATDSSSSCVADYTFARVRTYRAAAPHPWNLFQCTGPLVYDTQTVFVNCTSGGTVCNTGGPDDIPGGPGPCTQTSTTTSGGGPTGWDNSVPTGYD